MRYIDISDYNPSEEWLEEARVALQNATDLTEKERVDFIKKKAIWSKLQNDLMKLSQNKCWYTEARENASYYHVDHYRPKGKVKNLVPCDDIIETQNNLESYWWLAFEWTNYRLSASIPNTIKSSYFPLLKGTDIANDMNSLRNEFPALIDPLDEDDIALLDVNDEGRICPSVSVSKDSWDYQRVLISIKVYNLNFQTLVDARLEIKNRCSTLIHEIIDIYRDIDSNGNKYARSTLKEKNKELRNMTKANAEFSIAAKSYLLRSNHTFIRNLVS